jgi:uncharacterized Ntn-hydrolase superfamily protein
VTYSIGARDPSTGELGVAVQSHFFGVGPIVPWAEAGVGAVATQSVVDPAYGPSGLELMRGGESAPAALRLLLNRDEQSEARQVAMVDAHGRVAVHTGARCVAHAGHRVLGQASAQANIMARPTVWDAMVTAYEQAEGTLAERLLAALEAAEDEGGDLRGRQSAALTVVASRAGGGPRAERPVDLRVDDHPEPLRELRRLHEVHAAYTHIDSGDELAAAGDVEGALAEYAAAHRKQPGNMELAFWHGVALAAAGREDDARPLLERAFDDHAGWRELLRRLPDAALLPGDPGLVERLAGGRSDLPASPDLR